MADDTEALVVSFEAGLDDLLSVPQQMEMIFDALDNAAAVGSAKITESIEQASEGFSVLSDAGETASTSLSDSMSQSSSGFASLEEAVSALADSVNNAVAEINAQIDSIGENADEAAAQSEAAFSGFSLGGMINGAAMGVFQLQALGQMAAQTGQSLLGPAEQAENTQSSFSNLLGSTQAASQELDHLNQFAAKTQFKTGDIDNLAASMIAFKTPTQAIIPELSAVGDALTAVGKGTPAEMQSVVDVLGKMGIQGKLTQGDITQLGQHGIDALNAIALGSGKSTDAIQKMIKDGTFPAKDAIDDLTKGIEKNPIYSGGMAKQSETLSGQMSTLSSNVDQMMAAALKPALPELEKGIDELSKVVSSPSFKQFAEVLGKDIAKGLDLTFHGIENLVKFGKNLYDFFHNNRTAMDALVAGLIGVGVVIGAIVIPAFIAWGIAMIPVVAEALIAAAPFVLLGLIVAAVVFGIIEVVQHWSQIMAIAGDVVSNVWKDIQGAWNGAINFFKGIGEGIWAGIKWGINQVIGGIDGFIGFLDGIQIHIPAIGVGPVQTPSFDWGGLGIRKIPFLASGGTIDPGQWAIAGEAGPELLFGGSSGLSVFSNSQSQAMMQGSAGDTHIHIYVDGQEMTNVIMERAASMMRGHGPVGVVV